MTIKGKVIIITGASAGIGRAAALLLASRGAKLVLAARSSRELKALVESLPEAVYVTTDMRKPGNVAKMVESALKRYGRIDVLINNAAQGMYGPVETIDMEKYREIIELNVIAPLRAMQLAIPHMRIQGRGMVINVSSHVSRNYFPETAAYASTKYALNAISLTARKELAPDGIVVSVLLPRLTDTDFDRHALGERPDGMTADMDTPADVALKIAGLIESEAPEAVMP